MCTETDLKGKTGHWGGKLGWDSVLMVAVFIYIHMIHFVEENGGNFYDDLIVF